MPVKTDIGNQLVWYAIKPYLPAGTSLTSVRRSTDDQLALIMKNAIKLGYQPTRVAIFGDPSSWQPALQFVRARGIKIAAPSLSQHQRGLAYDFSGPDLNAIENAVRRAVAAGRITLLKTSRRPILQEPKNHCVHVEIESAILDFEPFDVV